MTNQLNHTCVAQCRMPMERSARPADADQFLLGLNRWAAPGHQGLHGLTANRAMANRNGRPRLLASVTQRFPKQPPCLCQMAARFGPTRSPPCYRSGERLYRWTAELASFFLLAGFVDKIPFAFIGFCHNWVRSCSFVF
jgi:hypothetical protein